MVRDNKLSKRSDAGSNPVALINRNGREKSKSCQARIFETKTGTKTNTPPAVG